MFLIALIRQIMMWWYARHDTITDEQGEERARQFGLLKEYRAARRFGLPPSQALEDWDMLYEDEMRTGVYVKREPFCYFKRPPLVEEKRKKQRQ